MTLVKKLSKKSWGGLSSLPGMKDAKGGWISLPPLHPLKTEDDHFPILSCFASPAIVHLLPDILIVHFPDPGHLSFGQWR